MPDRMESGLKRWTSRPLWLLNGIAVVSTTILMVWLFSLRQRLPEPEAQLRHIAILFMSIHGLLHVLSKRGLQLMIRHHKAGAEEALRVYLDVRRISHLDLAIAWIAFFALAPHLI